MEEDKEVSASEALFGFCGWITSRDESVIASAKHDAAVWADLIRRYCDAQGFSKPREDWTKNLVSMVGK